MRPEDAGDYWVWVNGVLNGTITGVFSRPAALTVHGPPAIATQPASTKVPLGRPATFQVSATGAGSLSYQWEKDGVALAGATSSELVIPSVKRSDAGSYRAIVTSTLNGTTASTISEPAILSLDACGWELVSSEPLVALPAGAEIDLPDGKQQGAEWIGGRLAWHQPGANEWLWVPFAGSISSWFEVEVDVHVVAPTSSIDHVIALGLFSTRNMAKGVEAYLSVPETGPATLVWITPRPLDEIYSPPQPVERPSEGWHTFTFIGNRDTCEVRLLIDRVPVSTWSTWSGACDLSGDKIFLAASSRRPGTAWSALTVSAGDGEACGEENPFRIAPRTAIAHAGGTPIDLSALFEGLPVPAAWRLESGVGSLSASAGETVQYLPLANLESGFEKVIVTATADEFVGRALIAVVPPGTLSLYPAMAILAPGGESRTFQATLEGGVEPITWRLTPEIGTLSAATGTQVVYTPPAEIEEDTVVTLTARAAGASVSARIHIQRDAQSP